MALQNAMAEKGESIYWVEVERIHPNPYQPRKEFDDAKLAGLSDSIRQYGILQPLVVTKIEEIKEDGGLKVSYELIAGERRLRASKLAGLAQVPVVIRTGEETNQMKLELAIIENLQREELNPIDRARAFGQLADEFRFKHAEIAAKVGKSREYVSNSLRLLSLPQEIQDALAEGRVTEGHARPLMMLNDRPAEQNTLFKEIMLKKLTVRDAEAIARRIAADKVRKKSRGYDPEIVNLEQQLTESLGTRVQIESREVGGKVVIDFFSNDDLRNLLDALNKDGGDMHVPDVIKEEESPEVVEEETKSVADAISDWDDTPQSVREEETEPIPPAGFADMSEDEILAGRLPRSEETQAPEPVEESIVEDKKDDDEDLYSLKNFSV